MTAGTGVKMLPITQSLLRSATAPLPKALVWASFGALGVAFIMYIPRRVVSFHNFMEGTIEGMKLMLPANVILVLAWTLSGVCRDLLTTQTFVQGMVSSGSGLDLFLPAAIFLVAAFLSFSTGTAWVLSVS